MAVPVAAIFVGICLLFLAVRIFRLASKSCPPFLHYTSSTFNKKILEQCPMLSELYIPTLLWGKSGHIQTIIYGKMGRINCPVPQGARTSIIMPDGATMTYDVFNAETKHPAGGDYTLLVVPGLANSSEALYIRTFVHYAQKQGFRVAVLNHLGVLDDVPLTSPRIFTYGRTEEYSQMVEDVQRRFPESVCIAVGFSMGGNIMMKYLSESAVNQAKVLCGISCCQGYDAAEAVKKNKTWENLRRAYGFCMTQNMKSLLKANEGILLGPEAEKKYGPFEKEKIFSATTLMQFDDAYSRKMAGYSNILDYYANASCSNVIDKITIPMFILNALDDPIVPNCLHTVPKEFAYKRDNVMYAITQHGGHLGYFEGGLLVPEDVTWLDKMVVQYANAAILATNARQVGGSKQAEILQL